MKIISRKCGICNHWYRPQAHANHCPICGVHPLPTGKTTLYANPISMRQVVRAFRSDLAFRFTAR